MRYVKMFLTGLFFLALIFTLFTLFIPSSVRVSRVTEIHAPADSIYKNISNIDNWSKWLPWSAADSLFISSIHPAPGNIGAYYAWNLKTDPTQQGKITITALHPDEIITQNELTGYKASEGSIKIHKDPSGNILLVEWKINVKLKWYPWSKLRGILTDKLFGPVLESGLEKLKTICKG